MISKKASRGGGATAQLESKGVLALASSSALSWGRSAGEVVGDVGRRSYKRTSGPSRVRTMVTPADRRSSLFHLRIPHAVAVHALLPFPSRLWVEGFAVLLCRMVARNNLEDSSAATQNRTSSELPAVDSLLCQSRQLQHTTPSPESQTRFRPFRNNDFRIITMTTSMLERSGFYWGPMTVEEAHGKLKQEPLGTFLIRDSRQKDVLFTLSYRAQSGPTSIRINFQESHFSLAGSDKTFDSIFSLLEHYVASPKKCLVRPYRKVKLQPLQELCRKRIIETCGREKIDKIPVNTVLKEFLNSFPYRL
ncbi:suppressor of cytokine signaling 1-like [Arapaima gigas]